MSEIQQLAEAVRMMGESCAALADHEKGARASLNQAMKHLRTSNETADIANRLASAERAWFQIETDVKGAALEAYQFGRTLA